MRSGSDPFQINPLHPLFGGEVRGVDLSKPPASERVVSIRAMMDELAVLVFRDQRLDDAQHIALSRAFGPLELPPDYRSGVVRRLRRELYDASNLDVEGKILPAESPRREYNKANLSFHADSTFNDLPTTWSLLRAHTVPAEGCNTELIDVSATDGRG
jgi:alpha-ketoglutarate-dependent 2,4-dichlorophenoxyacetate dioxygenase